MNDIDSAEIILIRRYTPWGRDLLEQGYKTIVKYPDGKFHFIKKGEELTISAGHDWYDRTLIMIDQDKYLSQYWDAGKFINKTKKYMYQFNQDNLTVTDGNKTYKLTLTEMEKPKVSLKYPNGAEVYAPSENTQVWYMNGDSIIENRWRSPDREDIYNLENQNIFLDFDAILHAKDVKDTHSQIMKRVVELNDKDQGGEVDWNDYDDYAKEKYCLCYSWSDGRIISSLSYYHDRGCRYMSKKVAEQIQKEFTVDELKKFLLIY